ncbi:MAG TPA: hypothetical protein VJV78_41680 [Polyangiales bacterium]|nr:hypothetical protein [Polyangiales bacterium]
MDRQSPGPPAARWRSIELGGIEVTVLEVSATTVVSIAVRASTQVRSRGEERA